MGLGTAPLWINTALISVHSALFGAGLVALGPFLKAGFHGSVLSDITLDTVQQSAATALLLLACIPGSFFTSFFVERFGNRIVLIANGFIWFTGGIFMLFETVPTLLIGRFILGLGVGVASVVPPIILNQIEPSNLKGTVANMHQISICAAQLILYLLAVIFVNVTHGWKWINAGLFIFAGVFTFVSGFLLIESPVWLLKNGQEGQALSMLRLLRQGSLRDFWARSRNEISDFANDPGAAIQSLRDRARSNHTTKHSDSNDQDDESIVATHQVFYGEDDLQPSQSNINPTGVDKANYDYNNYYNNGNAHDHHQDASINVNNQDLRASVPHAQSNLQEVAVGSTMDDPVYIELQAMKNTLNSSSREVTWKDLLAPEYRLQLLLCFGLMTVQPLSGINGIALFATKLFGFVLDDASAIWGTVAFGLLGFVATMATGMLLDKFGRKMLVIIGTIGCALFLFLTSIVLLTMDGFTMQGPLSLLFVCLYVIAFQPLGGPIWVLLGEYTASSIKDKAMPLYCVLNWAFNFLLVFVTLPMMTLFGGGESDQQLSVGAGWLFIVFGVICVLGTFFAFTCLIETAGRSEDEIQTELGARDRNESVPDDSDSLKAVVGDSADDDAY